MNYQTKNLVVYDIEVYRNYFLCGMMTPDGIITQYEDRASLLKALTAIKGADYELCGFNSNRYDDPVMSAFLLRGSTVDAWQQGHQIIHEDIPPWRYDVNYPSVDLMPLLPGRMSLKQIGVRLHHKKLQELPIQWEKELTSEEKEIIREYNKNDLHITRKLLDKIQPELDLRGELSRQYSMDVRSKGDAGIAEEIISHEVGKLLNLTKGHLKQMAKQNIADHPMMTVTPPTWWSALSTATLGNVAEVISSQTPRFDTNIPLDKNGRLALPKLSNLYLDDKYYSLGAGGLHSIDGPGSYVPDKDEFLVDIDVTSYYPAIMLTQELFPRHLGEHFGSVYRALVDQRLKAKGEGDKVTADRLKIAINGTFGKTSDPYSALYDPQVTAGTTIIGQVSLLILIAMLADAGFRTISTNTDGVTVIGKNEQKSQLGITVGTWERITNFNMEYTYYKSIYYRDVNNYCANILGSEEGKQKSKGLFAVKPGVDLRHALKGNIIAEAVKQYLLDGTPVEHTIARCRDINQFLLSHAATGDYKCTWWGEDIGKLVRFYKSTRLTACEIIKTDSVKGRQSNVPNSENCVPIQDLPETLPEDIDYPWYVHEARGLLKLISPAKKFGINREAEAIKHLRPCIISPSRVRSRAKTEYGSVDFNSMREDQSLGVMAGKEAGLIALVNAHTDEVLELYHFEGNLPSQVRINHRKKTGLNIIYGGAVKWVEDYGLINPLSESKLKVWMKNQYTLAELKKVGAV